MAAPSLNSLNVVDRSQTIFHFPFDIFQLSLPELAACGLVSGAFVKFPTLANEVAAFFTMTNEKCEMENRKWFDPDAQLESIQTNGVATECHPYNLAAANYQPRPFCEDAAVAHIIIISFATI